jgi:hypothetical protein
MAAKFHQGAAIGFAKCTAAKTTYADAANAVTLFTATGDTVIKHIGASPLASLASATQCQLFFQRGTVVSLLSAPLMAAFTMSATGAVPQLRLLHPDGEWITETNPIYLLNGDSLLVGISVANATGIQFTAFGSVVA